MIEMFELKARQDVDDAAGVLGSLACNNWYSDVTEVRKLACMKVVEQLMPVMTMISPEAAAQATSAGRNPMWDR